MKEKIFMIVLSIVLLCGCVNNNLNNRADHLAETIIESFREETPNKSKLTSKDKDLFNDFINKQKTEDYEINIDMSINFSNESYTEDENTNGIFKKNDNYYIKYKDINWELHNQEYRSIINLNNKQTVIYKKNFPIIYTDTKDNLRYTYSIVNNSVEETEINYYCKSLYDNSGLTIKFFLENNDISEIYLIFDDVYAYDNLENNDNKMSIGYLLLIILLFIFIIIFVIYVYNNIKNKRK